MGEKLRAGVIGLGILGAQHVQFLTDHPEAKVVSVADIRKEVAEELGGQIGAEAYTDYAQMLKEQRLDVAVVATPDSLHKEPVLAAVQAGVPYIIQEKPMATTVKEAEAMLDAAERAGARIFVHFSNRGSAMDRATYYVVREGLLGRIVYGEVHLDDNISVPTAMWGNRTREWAAGSSTAHFLLSHVVDFLHWLMAPAGVTQVYAISQREVLGYTPDLYDAHLCFGDGSKFRAKAEWIKHIDGLVEFSMSFSGAEGSLRYIKRPGFGEVEAWRANLTDQVTPERLLACQEELAQEGVRVRALLHKPNPTAGALRAGGGQLKAALEAFAPPLDWWRVARGFLDAILEDTLTPSSWERYGPLPTGVDGLRQTRVVAAIVESAETGKVIDLD